MHPYLIPEMARQRHADLIDAASRSRRGRDGDRRTVARSVAAFFGRRAA